MTTSRLRLRFSAAFALVLTGILGMFVAAGVWQEWRQSHQRLDDRLVSLAEAVDHALVRELQASPAAGGTAGETPDVRAVAAAVVRRWPHGEDGFAVLDSTARPMASLDPRGLSQRALDALRLAPGDRFALPREDDDGRAVQRAVVLTPRGAPPVHLVVLAFDSAEDIERDIQALTATLLVAVPLLVLLSLIGGYVLAGWALRPMGRLGDAIDALAPDDGTARVPLPPQRDEVFALAERVNTLLARVEAVRQRHQRFVRQAAHQIRTPLTLVLGEAEHALGADRAATTEAGRALARVLVAAEQMRRRVDELMLFAEAESGTAFARDERVDLDELAFECTDLMRRRAAALGRQLALVESPAVTVRGNAALLREALLELLENACRHGGASAPVTVGIAVRGAEAHLVVTSALPEAGGGAATGTGLGVPILEWIAAGHGGRFVRSSSGQRHESTLVLPIG